MALTAKQQEVVDYLREHGQASQGDLAKALGTTERGIGIRLSAIMWSDDPDKPVILSRREGPLRDFVYWLSGERGGMA